MAAYKRDTKWRPRGTPANFRSRQPGTSSDPSFVLDGLDKRVATLSIDAGYASELVQLRHVTSIASYSWMDAPVPTIVVPGRPTRSHPHH